MLASRNGAQLLELGKAVDGSGKYQASFGRNGAQLLELGKAVETLLDIAAVDARRNGAQLLELGKADEARRLGRDAG